MTEFLNSHGLLGIAIGLCTFLIIGLFHPLVIKGEYYLGQKSNWIFAIGGVACTVATILSTRVTPCSCFWSILEVREQRERVRKGWYPKRTRRETFKE